MPYLFFVNVRKENQNMKELQIFNNREFGQIRTIELEGKPYFMASDVAKALGYIRPNDAINQHCRATVNTVPLSVVKCRKLISLEKGTCTA